MMRYVVSRERRMLDVYEDNVLAASFPVAVGRAASPTPAGRWTVLPVAAVNDPDAVFLLSTPRFTCLRQTFDLDSLGAAASGG